MKVVVSLLAVVSAGVVSAAEKPDCRVRTLVDPVRIVATSPGLGADELCGPRNKAVKVMSTLV